MKIYINDDYTTNDLEFKKRLLNEGKFSYWCALVTFFMLIPFIAYTMINSIMFFKGPPFKVRCDVPPLENLSWGFDDIQRLIQPNDSNKLCTYYNYDYQKFSHMSFWEAFKLAKSSGRVKELPCSSLVFNDDSGFTTIYKDFTLFCHKTIETLIILANFIGNILGSIFLVPMADIYGRKVMLKFSLGTSQVAAVSLVFLDNMELFLFAKILHGIAFSITNVSLLILCNIQLLSGSSIQVLHFLAMELCAPLLRPCRFFMLHSLADGISYILIPLIAQFCSNWRYLLCYYSIGILILPLVEWFVPASPLWFYTKNKRFAWIFLKSAKTPLVNNETMALYKNQKSDLYGELNWLLNELKRIPKKTFWCHLILIAITGGICTSNNIEYFQDIFNSPFFLYFFAISRLISLTSSVFLIALIGRKTSIYVAQASLVILCIAITQCKQESTLAFATFYLIDANTNLLFGVCKLHAIENTSTTLRSTILGHYEIAASVFKIASFFVLRVVGFYLYFVVVSVLVCVCFVINWFADQDNAQELFH